MSSFNQGLDQYCNYPPKHLSEFNFKGIQCPFDHKTSKDSHVSTPLPPAQLHGGLYNSTSTNKPWHSIYVKPDVTYMINTNLQSANPPPGATHQFIGTNRPGNSSVNMPNVYKYAPEGQEGLYNFHLLMDN